MGLQMSKFCCCATELWPLIYAQILFLLDIFSIFWPVFFKLCIRVDIKERHYGIADE